MSVVDALQHPFMASLHDEADEPTAPFTIDFDFEGETLSRDDVRAAAFPSSFLFASLLDVLAHVSSSRLHVSLLAWLFLAVNLSMSC